MPTVAPSMATRVGFPSLISGSFITILSTVSVRHGAPPPGAKPTIDRNDNHSESPRRGYRKRPSFLVLIPTTVSTCSSHSFFSTKVLLGFTVQCRTVGKVERVHVRTFGPALSTCVQTLLCAAGVGKGGGEREGVSHGVTNLMYVARILQDARVVLGQGSISAASGRTCVPYTRGEDREYSRGFHHHYYSEFYEFNDGVIPKLRPTTGKEYCASVCALRHTHPVPIHQCATHPTTNFFKIELND